VKLRWKFFCVLLVFSLAPLGVVALIGHHENLGTSAAIATDVSSALIHSTGSVLKLWADTSARILDKTKVAVEFALADLARETEVVLAEAAPAPMRVYFAADFDAAATAPPDLAPRAATGDAWVSLEHPAALLAPGAPAQAAEEDIDRLSLLADAFLNLTEKLGRSLHWVHVTTESGAHISFPGHGGYPDGFDPRERSWYRNAADDAVHWSPPYVDAITGQLTMTASRAVRGVDGARVGVAAVDVLLNDALRVQELSAWWTAAARSMIVRPVYDPATRTTELRIVAQKDSQSPPNVWAESAAVERLAADDPNGANELARLMAAGQAGLLELPFGGTPSVWALAPSFGGSWFVVIVPRTVIERAPERTLDIVRRHTREREWAMAAAAAGAVVLAAIAALLGSRGFTRPMVELVEAAGRLSRGDYDVQVHSRTRDERDQLIRSFNEMVPRLKDHLRMHESLQLATEVQQNLLPKVMPAFAGMDVSALSIYCDETGGDYYDFIADPNDPSGPGTIVVADVSGHGAHAALLMASARAGLRLRASLPGTAADIVADVNRMFSEDVGDTGSFMTMFYLTVDGPGRSMRWVRAGHDPAILYDPRSGRFEELGGRGAPLGFDPGTSFQERFRTDLVPGAIIFVGTDGIWEAMAPDGTMFGKAALHELIRTNSRRSAGQIVAAVVAAIEAHRQGAKPADDITMAVVKLT
jgi:sigma-B regulation protein RsbU (phosphoserine phosphatase)